jgi:hypothetical protein
MSSSADQTIEWGKSMKFQTSVNFEVDITNFERFSHETMELVEFTSEMKMKVAQDFDIKKFSLALDMSAQDPKGDGFTLYATASSMKKAKYGIVKVDDVFKLQGAAVISIGPLRISNVKASDYIISAIRADLWKGTEDSVQLHFDAVKIDVFAFVE